MKNTCIPQNISIRDKIEKEHGVNKREYKPEQIKVQKKCMLRGQSNDIIPCFVASVMRFLNFDPSPLVL